MSLRYKLPTRLHLQLREASRTKVNKKLIRVSMKILRETSDSRVWNQTALNMSDSDHKTMFPQVLSEDLRSDSQGGVSGKTRTRVHPTCRLMRRPLVSSTHPHSFQHQMASQPSHRQKCTLKQKRASHRKSPSRTWSRWFQSRRLLRTRTTIYKTTKAKIPLMLRSKSMRSSTITSSISIKRLPLFYGT